MAYAMDFLIPSAVLYAHPGIKREDFAEILRQLRWPASGWKDTGFYYSGGRYASPEYKLGIFSVAEILSLPRSEEFQQAHKVTKDQNGLELYPPGLYPEVHEVPGGFLDPRFEVVTHTENRIVSERKEVEVYRASDSSRPYQEVI
jgi:hypothetical protein